MAIDIKINGVKLVPQPAEANWVVDIIDQKLDGTDALGSYRIFQISSPRTKDSGFNWDTYENQVLTSITAFAPGDSPDGTEVTYNSGVVSRRIREYQIDINRTFTVDWEIAVIV